LLVLLPENIALNTNKFKTHKMKKKKVIIWTIVIAVIAFLLWFLILRKEEQKVVFETAFPATGDISEKVTATGTVQIVDTVAVGTQVSGIVKAIYVDYNSVVKKGQLLAEIDPTLLQAQADQIKGTLASAQSNVTYQKSNFGRQKQLFETGAISRADYDNASNNYNAAVASESSIQAQLRSANQNLKYTKIYSPIDGVVLSRSVSTGQTVAASFSTPTLFVLAKDISNMVVYASVDEADISKVAVGQKATFTVDAYLDDIFKGNVSELRLQPTISSNVVTYSTLVNVDNTAHKLKPGMTATISILSKEAQHAMLIPVKAIKYSPSGQLGKDYKLEPLKEEVTENTSTASIWVKNGNILQQKKISIGINDNTHVEVLGGLVKTDTLIIATPSGAAAAQTAGSSPFMPKMPSRKKK
jgi:HlyD family secretion protein